MAMSNEKSHAPTPCGIGEDDIEFVVKVAIENVQCPKREVPALMRSCGFDHANGSVNA